MKSDVVAEVTRVKSGRLPPDVLETNFKDIHPPLNAHEALVEADRCYFCYDAPCTTACPTDIDIPLFIRQILTANPLGSAKTIFDQNILGGMCARVCPTETLCEQVCVRETAEGKPVKIGQLQRYATDAAMASGAQFYERAAESTKKVAVIGAGPAGLACAHRLALYGHDVSIYDAAEKPGGLNEFGIAAYKTVDGFAQHEVDYITAIGGISIHYGQALGREVMLGELCESHDAVFVGLGLQDTNDLHLGQGQIEGIEDAVDFISRLRQAEDLSSIKVGDRVVVIGGGMTAIDAAVQAKLLGADEVTICYRSAQAKMKASAYEQELAVTRGVVIRCGLAPKRVEHREGRLSAIVLTRSDGSDEEIILPADQVLTAIGQALRPEDFGSELTTQGDRIVIDEVGKTSMDKVWAGGDCTNRGENLTVTAVAQGRDAAESIHLALTGGA